MNNMCEVLGYNNFCSACKGSMEENGELICHDKDGAFYGLPVKCVLLAPCMIFKEEMKRKDGDNETD